MLYPVLLLEDGVLFIGLSRCLVVGLPSTLEESLDNPIPLQLFQPFHSFTNPDSSNELRVTSYP